jgi:hypothetical protein
VVQDAIESASGGTRDMPNANVIELEACLEDVLKYCDANPETAFVQYYHPRVLHSWRTYSSAMTESDAKFIQWRREEEDDRMMWKHVALELAATQRQLKRLNAVGFPTEKLGHWDEEALVDLVNEMLTYLQERRSVIEGASKLEEVLKQKLARAKVEKTEDSLAFREYRRIASTRADALGSLSAHLWEFRGALRRQSGKRDPSYTDIRWTYSLNPDDNVL